MPDRLQPNHPTPSRVLAIETSTRHGSLALYAAGGVVAEADLPADRRTAQSLAPTLDWLLREHGWKPTEVDLVTLTHGPGSFTGLRIAVTTAKTFAYAVRADLVAIDTLDVIAHQLPPELTCASVILDAQRGQLFAADYRRQAGQDWQLWRPCRILDRAAWLDSLSAGVTVTGPAVHRLAEVLPEQVRTADEACWHPRASTVARLGCARYQQGQRDDFWTLTPRYYRPSYAEESAS